uniref:Uncharacterized protein LOC113794020 n=1 Tax=Dermatophagoides pteronyssinus TaxID=6956 RepID=A0A6P6Y342_DERPT|nr:uncharacterized protein LOC113794020 [Dermatophagoides pteronyssinus]
MPGSYVLIEWANELAEISIFQIKDFDPNWMNDNYPTHPIIYTRSDFIQSQGYIKFIGTSDEVKAKKEEIATARIVSMENNEIKELKLMMLAMEKKLDEQSKKINQLEQKLDYLTQGSSTDNNIITTGKNRIKVFVNDLSAALIPNDEIKGLYVLCQTVFGEEIKPEMTWREHSQEIRQNITDLIYLFVDHKHSESEDKKKMVIRLKQKFIKKLNNQKKKNKINQIKE